MYEICPRDDFNTDFRVWGDLGTLDAVRDLVGAYRTHFLALPPKQIVFVTINEGTSIPFEQMFYVFTGIKAFHAKYKLIESVNIYMSDRHIAQCCRCLMNLFSPTVPINILLKPI